MSQTRYDPEGVARFHSFNGVPEQVAFVKFIPAPASSFRNSSGKVVVGFQSLMLDLRQIETLSISYARSCSFTAESLAGLA